MTTLRQDLDQICGDAAPPKLPRNRAKAFSMLAGIAAEHAIGYPRTLALFVKYEAERQAAAGQLADFMGSSLLAEWPTVEMAAALQKYFKDDPQFHDKDLLVQVMEIMLMNLHTAATNSDALAFYARQGEMTTEQTAAAPPETKKAYDMRKKAWLRAHDEFGNLLLHREDCLLRADGLRQLFMQSFAGEFIAEKQQSGRLDVAQARLKLIAQNPELGGDEIEQLLVDEKEKHREKMRSYQLSASYGLSLPADYIPDADQHDIETAKNLLKRIAMLVHPDRRQGLNLTRDQHRQLDRIWRDTHALRGNRGGQGMLCRSVESLQRSLEQAQEILKLAGVEGLDAAMTIQGETLEERVEWLDRACTDLDQQIIKIQAEIYAVNADPELKFFRALVDAPPHVQEEQREAMKKNAEECRKEAERLEKEADELLTIKPPPGGLH